MVSASLLLPNPPSLYVIFICTHLLINNERLTSIVDWRDGRSLSVGSRGGEKQVGQLAAYCAAKAGVVALTKAIADETKGTNITANTALASVIDPPTNCSAMGSENTHQWVELQSLAQVICFLGSEAAKDVRGAAMAVYGSI
ncbi:SDR family oxidoreductase [Microcoleus sp. OTE_8_concoct_300]|uniref:SDR family oxidoreductase n=1 Tax=Microcoleus sp. OTE_8_concoct_300 TaxID=2964710 RepID=UPI00403F4301